VITNLLAHDALTTQEVVMAREPEHKPVDTKADHPDRAKPDTKADHPRVEQANTALGREGPRGKVGSDPYGGGRVTTLVEGGPPVARPTILSATSDQLQFVVDTHAEVFSPDELSVLNAATVELKDYEALTAPPPPPVVRDTPLVMQEGAQLTCTMGNWDGEPTGYEYQWSRDGAFVVGGPTGTYAVTTPDVGTTFTCVVVATNAQGSTAAPPSNGVVVVEPPVTRAA
jgi:hypothetical protein